jgi:ATP-dependent helicase/nuclease subunit A
VKQMLTELVESALTTDRPLDDFFVTMPQGTNDYLATIMRYTRELLNQVGDENKTLQKWRCDASEALEAACALVPDIEHLTRPERLQKLRSIPLESQLKAIDTFPKPNRNLKAFKSATLPETTLSAQDAYFAVSNACRAAIGAEHLKTLLALVPVAVRRFHAAEAERGLIDNDGLIVRTSRMLKDPANASIRTRYVSRFKLVMVDEFQDTNQMQVDLINLVAGGTDERISDRLCVVGDAQQSIYRFRDADLSVFQNHVSRLRADDPRQCIEMGVNYRSHAEILAFCKGAFSGTFGEGYLDLLHGRDEGRASEAMPFLGAQGEPRADNAGNPRRINVKALDFGRRNGLEESASSIADDFARLIELGHEPSDMVILLGRMTNADVFARELSARHIPCAVTGGSTFKDLPEVKMVLALLDALVDMEDTQALASVLSFGLFELCPADFLCLVPGTRWKRPFSYTALARRFAEGLGVDKTLRKERTVPNGLACALDVLRRASAQVGSRPLSAIIADVMAQSGWLSRMQGAGKERVANALKAVRIIEDVEEDQNLDGRSLAVEARSLIENSKQAPGVLAAQGDNFVRIMTIHASKGLQFPIVAVADALPPRPPKGKLTSVTVRGRRLVALDAGGSISSLPASHLVKSAWKGLAASLEDKDAALAALTPDGGGRAAHEDGARFSAAVRAYDHFSDEEEYQRKLYVAYTRARDCLIVALKYDRKALERGDGTSQACIERTLCGPGGTFTSDQTQGHSCSLYPVHTSYDDPRYDLDWTARVEVLQPEPTPEEGAGDEDPSPVGADAGAMCEEAPSECQEGARFLVPTLALPTYSSDDVYGLNWTNGTLSASSIKKRAHAEDEAMQIPEPEIIDANDADAALEETLASATEKGTAFHALAECSIRNWVPGQALALPTEERIDAIARAHGLSRQQRTEVEGHLRAWVSSGLATRIARHARLRAEVPFWLQLDDGDGRHDPLVMQGFIDLLAYDEMGEGTAFVVDYKTGFSLDTDAKRREAYEVQAMTYAYAVLSQGFEDVRLSFVFVEQRDEDGKAPIVEFPAPDETPYQVDALRQELAGLVHA